MTLDQFNSLKAEIDSARQQEGRAEGAVAQIKKGLKEKFKASSLENARKMLAGMDKEAEVKGEKLETLAEEWRGKWNGKL